MSEYLAQQAEYADDAPTIIFQCGACAAHIEFFGALANEPIDGKYTLEQWHFVGCTCGAMYTEGDELNVIEWSE